LKLNINANVNNNVEIGNISGLIGELIIENAIVKIFTGEQGIKYGTIFGQFISGKLKNIIIDSDNNFFAYFEGEISNSITNLKLEDFKFIHTLFERNIDKLNFDTNFKILNSRFISTSNIFSAIKTINSIKSELDLNLSKITGVSFYDKSTDQFTNIFNLLEPISISPDGLFSIEFNNVLINGVISSNTGLISISAVNTENNPNLILFELEIDCVFKYFPIRGPGNIEQITIDFNLTNESISIISPIEISNYSPDKFNLVLDNLISTKLDATNRYEIRIAMPHFNNDISSEFSFYFTKSGYITDQTKLDFILDVVNSTASESVFSTTERFTMEYLNSVSKLYPLFFSAPITR
jgi:hypothetical protein